MKNILYIILSFGFVLASCTDMNEISKKFLTEEIRYAGSPDTIKVLAGKNRVILHFRLTDASVVKLNVSWNNKSESMDVPVTMDVTPKVFDIVINDLAEGSYSFEITTADKMGNKSIVSRAAGKVYGTSYFESLLNTPLKAYKTDQLQANLIEAVWGTPDLTALGMDFMYTNSAGEQKKIYVEVPKAENLVFDPKLNLNDYKDGTPIKYCTYYLPEENAVDTFITDIKEITVKGFAVDYDRSFWTIEGKYDLGNPRPPQNLLDGSLSTVWHMDKTPGKYPHSVIVDMSEEVTLSGFYLQQRSPITTPAKAVAFKVSSDRVKWTSVGEFTMSNTTTAIQRFDLQLEITGRYIELIVKSDYNNGGSTALAELGAYKR